MKRKKAEKGIFKFDRLQKILACRFPFLMVDEVLTYEPKKRISILKNISGNELTFLGHFKNEAVMPGVLILETMIQGALLLHARGNSTPPFSLKRTKARFLQPVLPGDQMKTEVTNQPPLNGEIIFEGRALVKDRLMAKGTLIFITA